MRVTFGLRAAVASGLLVSSLASCQSVGKPAPAGGVGRSSTAVRSLISYDPPKTFSPGAGIKLPEAAATGVVTAGGWIDGETPVALDGARGFIGTATGLQCVDLATGQVLWNTPLAGQSADSATSQRPSLIRDGGRTLVAAASSVTVAGQGTTPAHQAARLLIVDASTGKEERSVDIPLPEALAGSSHALQSKVVAADKATAVVQVSGSKTTAAVAIDVGSGTIRWTVPGFSARALNGDAVVGTLATGDALAPQISVVALDASTHQQRWSTPPLRAAISVYPAGATAVVIVTPDASIRRTTVSLLSSATGTPAATAELQNIVVPVDCLGDGAATVVCRTTDHNGEQQTVAFDTSGRLRWTLPGSGRVAPHVTAAFHGTIYGITATGPVALDAVSGADRADNPGTVVYEVDQYGGIGVDQSNDFSFSPAGS